MTTRDLQTNQNKTILDYNYCSALKLQKVLKIEKK